MMMCSSHMSALSLQLGNNYILCGLSLRFNYFLVCYLCFVPIVSLIDGSKSGSLWDPALLRSIRLAPAGYGLRPEYGPNSPCCPIERDTGSFIPFPSAFRAFSSSRFIESHYTIPKIAQYRQWYMESHSKIMYTYETVVLVILYCVLEIFESFIQFSMCSQQN